MSTCITSYLHFFHFKAAKKKTVSQEGAGIISSVIFLQPIKEEQPFSCLQREDEDSGDGGKVVRVSIFLW